MFDSDSRAPAVTQSPTISPVEFYTVELSPLRSGEIFVSLVAITFDNEEPQLLSQEIADGRFATIDDALALVKRSVQLA